MTIICAITDGEETHIATDRLFVLNGSRNLYRADPAKGFEYEGWYIAFSGEAWQERIAYDYRHEIFADFATGEPDTILPYTLAGRLRRVLIQNGAQEKVSREGDYAPNICQGVLVARHDCIWLLDSALTPVEWPRHLLAAQGHGQAEARGAAWVIAEYEPDAVTNSAIVEAAVGAACALDVYCEGMWHGVLSRDGLRTIAQ